MTVSIKAQIRRSIPSDGVYKVQVDVIDVVNIDFDVLTFNTETGEFVNVATVYDLETYPVGQSAAQSQNKPFFRGRGMFANYSSLLAATNFADVTEQRLKQLAVDWGVVTDDFAAEEIITVDSSTSS